MSFHFKVSKGDLPCQAAYNNLYVLDKIPQELFTLEKLEQILIAERLVDLLTVLIFQIRNPLIEERNENLLSVGNEIYNIL